MPLQLDSGSSGLVVGGGGTSLVWMDYGVRGEDPC
jgi:hypothetical protein